MAWWFSGCRAEVETIPILLLNHFLFAYRTFSKSVRQFMSTVSEYYLMLCHDFAVRFKPKIRNVPVFAPTRRKIHFFYYTRGNDFQYLIISLKSLELLHLDCLGKIYIYVDKKDVFNVDQIKELKDNFSLSMEIRITNMPLSWGGVKLLLSELATFKEIIRDIPPYDYIFKVDSDVLFISDRIFKKVLSENHDAVGQRSTYDNFMEGGSYFLKSALVWRIVSSPIYKAMRYASNSWRCPISESGEDRAITKLAKQNRAKLLLCEYRLHGSEFREPVKWEAINTYSVIHFSPYYSLRKKFMIEIWEILKKEKVASEMQEAV
jgi:hypothetical protein